MEKQPGQSLSTGGPRSVTYIVRQDHSFPHRLHARLQRRSKTASVVVLAGLAVIITALVAVMLDLLVWEVLT